MHRYYYSRKKKTNFRFPFKIIGGCFIGIGIISLIYFFFPLFSWQVYFSSASATTELEVPIPKGLLADTSFKGLFSQGLNRITTNYEDARNWYPQVTSNTKNIKVSSYSLSIPKLNISNADVSAIDYDLTQHLVQYFGTAIPGENGTAVIFGHSTLPQLFNSSDYKTIFATLHTLKNDDEIFINVDGLTYKYKIFSISVVDPSDTNIFNQSYDNSYITLVTCTPPGTVWKRLVVRAKLVNINE